MSDIDITHPYIDPQIKGLKETIVYARKADLLWRPADTISSEYLTPAFVYHMLLCCAKSALNELLDEHKKVETLPTQSTMIVGRRAIPVGIVFLVRDGEIVGPDEAFCLRTLRGQLGRVWN